MLYKRYSPSKIDKKTHPHLKHVSKCWQTIDGKYDILYDEIIGFKHLRISRTDGEPIHNFMDFQEIKNDLLGKLSVAIEIYPRQPDFVNGSNTYHLWSWKGMEVPNLKELYDYIS